MINNVVLVGRLCEDPVLKQFESEVRGAFVTLAVTRAFKNMEDKYDTDFIKCSVWEGIAANVCEYCKKGDIVGIRGRIVTRSNEIVINEEEKKFKKFYTQEVVAEKVMFICSARKYDANKSVAERVEEEF